jgi:VWFA-related protein
VTRRFTATSIAVVLTVVLCPAHSLGTAHQDQFRAVTDAVVVDVTVRLGDRAVTDLAGSEFRVLDDGVPQAAQLAATRAVPLDLWILTDTGGEMNGLSARKAFPARIRAIAGRLRAGDRLAVLTMGHPMRTVLPLSAVPLTLDAAVPIGGSPNVFDGIADALMTRGAAGRRHVILAQCAGVDLVSVTSRERLADVAASSDAILDVAFSGLRPPGDTLRDLARSTGGDAFNSREFENAVRKLLESLEHTYVLTYTATGVPRQGWHTITVTVTRPGTFTIGARRGYFVD